MQVTSNCYIIKIKNLLQKSDYHEIHEISHVYKEDVQNEIKIRCLTLKLMSGSVHAFVYTKLCN